MRRFILALAIATAIGAATVGAPRTVMINGVVCLLGSWWFHYRLPAIRKVMRPIYVRMGILPEIADGLGASSDLTRPGGQ